MGYPAFYFILLLTYFAFWVILLLGLIYFLCYSISWVILLFGLFYFLGYSTSWDILLLGLSCFLGYSIFLFSLSCISLFFRFFHFFKHFALGLSCFRIIFFFVSFFFKIMQFSDDYFWFIFELSRLLVIPILHCSILGVIQWDA